MIASTRRIGSTSPTDHEIHRIDITTQRTACITTTPNGVVADAAAILSHHFCTARP